MEIRKVLFVSKTQFLLFVILDVPQIVKDSNYRGLHSQDGKIKNKKTSKLNQVISSFAYKYKALIDLCQPYNLHYTCPILGCVSTAQRVNDDRKGMLGGIIKYIRAYIQA